MESTNWKAGFLGGIVGAIVFGIMMQVMGMIPVIAGLVGSSSVAVGWLVHLVIGAVIGLLFAATLGKAVSSGGTAVLWGVVYGGIWWFLGPLIIMPSLMGAGLQLSAEGMQNALPSLWGHLLFGLVLGVVYQMSKK